MAQDAQQYICTISGSPVGTFKTQSEAYTAGQRALSQGMGGPHIMNNQYRLLEIRVTGTYQCVFSQKF